MMPPRVSDVSHRLQVRMVAANMLNKQYQTSTKKILKFMSWESRQRPTSEGLGLWRIFWIRIGSSGRLQL
jgi:hypothetical protein